MMAVSICFFCFVRIICSLKSFLQMWMSFISWSVCILLKICSKRLYQNELFLFLPTICLVLYSTLDLIIKFIMLNLINVFLWNIFVYNQFIIIFLYNKSHLLWYPFLFFYLIQWHSYLIVQILFVAVVNSNECKCIDLWIILLHMFYWALFIRKITKPTLILDAFYSHLVSLFTSVLEMRDYSI